MPCWTKPGTPSMGGNAEEATRGGEFLNPTTWEVAEPAEN